MAIDLRRIWEAQAPSDPLLAAMSVAASAAYRFLLHLQRGSNPTEWAKRPACWSYFQEIQLEYGDTLEGASLSLECVRAEKASARRDQRMFSEVEAQAAVVRYGAAFWQNAGVWARERKLTSSMEDGILEVAGGIRLRAISGKQAIRALSVMERLREKGFEIPDL